MQIRSVRKVTGIGGLPVHKKKLMPQPLFERGRLTGLVIFDMRARVSPFRSRQTFGRTRF
jgi:hypothetical protein